MRNRAKCMLCNQIIESVSRHDYVSCNCGEISIDGGPDEGFSRMRANNFDNFRIVHDDGTEVKVRVNEREPEDISKEPETVIETAPTKEELIGALEHLSNVYRDLPQGAKNQPVTHSDLHSFLDICLALFRSS